MFWNGSLQSDYSGRDPEFSLRRGAGAALFARSSDGVPDSRQLLVYYLGQGEFRRTLALFFEGRSDNSLVRPIMTSFGLPLQSCAKNREIVEGSCLCGRFAMLAGTRVHACLCAHHLSGTRSFCVRLSTVSDHS